MNLVIISCLLLFIIYFSIIGLLLYYFFRERNTITIFYQEIFQEFARLVSGCSIHNTFGLFIPSFIYSSSVPDVECYECVDEDKLRASNLYNVQLLYNIYALFKSLDVSVFGYEELKLSSRCKMFQFLLDYIIRNYKELYNGDLALYERLQMVYQDNYLSSSINKFPKSNCINNNIGIEIIPILEEHSKIFEKLDTICREINIEMINGTFLIAFYKDFRNLIKDAKNYLLEFTN